MWDDRGQSPACRGVVAVSKNQSLTPESTSAAESLSPAEHGAACRTGHHRRRFQPELPPLFAPAIELQPLVVLGAAEQRFQLLVRGVLLHALLKNFDGFLLLAPLVFDPGVDGVEQGLAFVSSHRAVANLLHLGVMLAAERDGDDYGL